MQILELTGGQILGSGPPFPLGGPTADISFPVWVSFIYSPDLKFFGALIQNGE